MAIGRDQSHEAPAQGAIREEAQGQNTDDALAAEVRRVLGDPTEGVSGPAIKAAGSSLVVRA
jgi:hypothetical protein